MTAPPGGAPQRIDQIIPAIVEHDAVSNHTFAAQELLRELGFDSEIYARIIGPGCDGRVRSLGELAQLGDGSQWVLYQASIGSPAAEVFARHPGIKLLDYHNITPAELVERYLPPLGDESRLGRAQLAALARVVPYAFADSAFNAGELEALGFPIARVVHVLVAPGNLESSADPTIARHLAERKRGGGAQWLFVGQLGPHKAQHDVIKAFACYRRLFDDRARLTLVGREMGNVYRDALRRFVTALGLDDVVELTGSVSTGELVAHYEAADVFVCCSDHEGFCAPIVEAMTRGLPVVAYAAAAVPETVGSGGVLLEHKDPLTVASAVDAVLAEPARRLALSAAARRQAARFTLEAARRDFRSAIGEACELLGAEP